MLLRRITQHIKAQNWFAVFIDFVIVVCGVFIGIQVANWNAQRQQANLEKSYLIRLNDDLNETISHLTSQIELTKKIKTVIKDSLLILNDEKSSDSTIVNATTKYITEGTKLTDFTVIRTTFDDLKTTGNLSILQNKALVKALGDLHTDFSTHVENSLVNTDWVIPFESKITIDFDFMHFDSKVKHIFPTRPVHELANHVRDHLILLQRHAGIHYWYIAAISDDYKNALEESKVVQKTIQHEIKNQ